MVIFESKDLKWFFHVIWSYSGPCPWFDTNDCNVEVILSSLGYFEVTPSHFLGHYRVKWLENDFYAISIYCHYLSFDIHNAYVEVIMSMKWFRCHFEVIKLISEITHESNHLENYFFTWFVVIQVIVHDLIPMTAMLKLCWCETKQKVTSSSTYCRLNYQLVYECWMCVINSFPPPVWRLPTCINDKIYSITFYMAYW